MEQERKTERHLMWQNGGPGVYACDWRKYYTLKEDEWRFDVMPEIMDGRLTPHQTPRYVDRKFLQARMYSTSSTQI
jgi:nucleolar GTP-binding protein